METINLRIFPRPLLYILKVNNNGTVQLMVKSVNGTYNIIHLVPFHSEMLKDPHWSFCNILLVQKLIFNKVMSCQGLNPWASPYNAIQLTTKPFRHNCLSIATSFHKCTTSAHLFAQYYGQQ